MKCNKNHTTSRILQRVGLKRSMDRLRLSRRGGDSMRLGRKPQMNYFCQDDKNKNWACCRSIKRISMGWYNPNSVGTWISLDNVSAKSRKPKNVNVQFNKKKGLKRVRLVGRLDGNWLGHQCLSSILLLETPKETFPFFSLSLSPSSLFFFIPSPTFLEPTWRGCLWPTDSSSRLYTQIDSRHF